MWSFGCVCVLTGRGVIIWLCLCVNRERCHHGGGVVIWLCLLTGRGVVILLCFCVDRERCGHLAVATLDSWVLEGPRSKHHRF